MYCESLWILLFCEWNLAIWIHHATVCKSTTSQCVDHTHIRTRAGCWLHGEVSEALSGATRAPGAGGWPPRPHSPRPPHEDDASGRRARVGASTALRKAWQAVWAQGRNRPKWGTCTPTRLCARCSDAPTRCWFSAGTLSPGTAHGGRPKFGC